MAGIKDYSTTNLNNTSLNGISVAEGMLPSNLNNAIRALMVNTREWFNDSQWVEYGDGDPHIAQRFREDSLSLLLDKICRAFKSRDA